MGSNRMREWAAIAGFFLFLATPLAVQIFASQMQVSHTEKRQMAEAPAMPMAVDDWIALPRRADAYLTDHFGLREHMVRTFGLLKFRLGESASQSVLIGRDGWLFFTGENVIDQHRGLDVFTEAELDEWVASLQAMSDATQRCGARFVFTVAPNKHTIYPEYLPRWARRVGDTTRLDQLFRRLAESTNIQYVDLRPPLTAAKRDQQLYFRFDTHWNRVGAFVAYDAIMRAAGDSRIVASTLALSDLVSGTTLLPGDLAGMLGLEGILVEPTTLFEIANPPSNASRRYLARYPSGEPHSTILVVESDPLDHPKIMIIGDSFNTATAPLFEGSASRYIWTHHRFGEFDFRLVQEYQPDLVVFEIAERLLVLPFARPIGLEEILTPGSAICNQQPGRLDSPSTILPAAGEGP